MAVSLNTYVDGYLKGLTTLEHLLERGLAFAKEQGVSEAEMLEWRLAPDMFNLRQQVMTVASFTNQWVARAMGDPDPAPFEGEPGLAELRARIAQTRAFLQGLEPGKLDARADEPLTADLGVVSPTLPVAQWVTGFLTTNFYFHLSMAYAILRNRGVPLGKRDLFAGGL
ncbi:DUF1993 domain-containing protein [Phenylobacterium sp.]|jgi:hypothetical protein|uniref:DUF1993 domain-containing protein n=1 Tax=Phenylobacterium sp. TaxID=1871053 RepID=UPI002F943FBD